MEIFLWNKLGTDRVFCDRTDKQNGRKTGQNRMGQLWNLTDKNRLAKDSREQAGSSQKNV